MNYLQKINGDTIPGIVAEVKDSQQVRTVEAFTLDGSPVVQIIGKPSRTVEVMFYTSNATRRMLEGMVANGEPIRVYWHNTLYKGIIADGVVNWEKGLHRRVNVAEKVSFKMLCSEVI